MAVLSSRYLSASCTREKFIGYRLLSLLLRGTAGSFILRLPYPFHRQPFSPPPRFNLRLFDTQLFNARYRGRTFATTFLFVSRRQIRLINIRSATSDLITIEHFHRESRCVVWSVKIVSYFIKQSLRCRDPALSADSLADTWKLLRLQYGDIARDTEDGVSGWESIELLPRLPRETRIPGFHVATPKNPIYCAQTPLSLDPPLRCSSRHRITSGREDYEHGKRGHDREETTERHKDSAAS